MRGAELVVDLRGQALTPARLVRPQPRRLVHADRQGLFADTGHGTDNPKARALAATFDGTRNRLVLHP
ncbi:hypothetical protein [Streptomyces sp. NEAU-H3]|uniref:hypothetical protein n=1 Tax=Streptomyces sp. NEAU-H3 TaxID=2720636 RepID=UPI001FD7F653|nr:hypothetical protein [Streptomyces sp. NEAU-H3]